MAHNPNCDGDHCRSDIGDVRLLPTGGGSNLILCRPCYEHEIAWRRSRNNDLAEWARFDLPAWADLTVYP
jgi:hypothetical protein